MPRSVALHDNFSHIIGQDSNIFSHWSWADIIKLTGEGGLFISFVARFEVNFMQNVVRSGLILNFSRKIWCEGGFIYQFEV